MAKTAYSARRGQVNGTQYAEEEIRIRTFQSSEALKMAIQKKVVEYAGIGWQLLCLSGRGAAIVLTFQQG